MSASKAQSCYVMVMLCFMDLRGMSTLKITKIIAIIVIIYLCEFSVIFITTGKKSVSSEQCQNEGLSSSDVSVNFEFDFGLEIVVCNILQHTYSNILKANYIVHCKFVILSLAHTSKSKLIIILGIMWKRNTEIIFYFKTLI